MRRLSIPVVIILAATPAAFGAVIVEHVGANDPTIEGWMLHEQKPGAIYEPVHGDLGSVDSWRLDTITNQAEGDHYYQWNLTPSQVTEAETRGWELSTTLRLVQADPHGLTMYFITGTGRLWQMWVEGTLNGDPVLCLGDGRTKTLDHGNGLYHAFRLTDPDADGLADVYVDGVLTFTGLSWLTDYSGRGIVFGDVHSSSSVNGHALYSQVTFEILPEPSTALLLSAAGFLVLRRRHQRM